MEENLIKYKDEEIIVKENAESSYMYVVKSGKVILYLHYGEEDEHVLGAVSAGKVFGENGLFLHTSSIYTAVAYGDVTVVKISRENFREFVISHPDSVLGLVDNMSKINLLLKENITLLIEENMGKEAAEEKKEELTVSLAKCSTSGKYHYFGRNK